ncbi:MAG: discoidin domain-containing protein [Muribaculaceae bacterium]|nr:discoidin domain-containing protein [Muribaculaceae bacterium]
MNRLLIATIIAASIPAAVSAADINETTDAKPRVYLVSDAHLDTQWEWDIQTTISQYVWNTINQNLKLLQTYPDYVFNFEGGVKYAWMKEYFPREYELMIPYIKADRWHISGASWDANDVIVPSPESMIRNILLGQEFFRKEFGVESTDIFLPDCFGFGWTLPTIAKHCGLIGFSSQKLGWRNHPFYDGNRRYPFAVGVWQGIDGSELMFAHGYDYTSRWQHEDLTQSDILKNRLKESPIDVLYHYYGTGDRGGSPTITSVETTMQSAATEGDLEIISATSDRMYKDFFPLNEHPELPRFNGELLMDVHGTGCYTSAAAMKLYNRQNELLADAAERASVAAELLGVGEYPSQNLTEAWKRFIFHQFHDDLTGTSIPRVYEFSWNDELLSLKQFTSAMTTAVDGVSQLMDTRVDGIPVVMYNPLGFEVTDVVEILLPDCQHAARVDVTAPNGSKVPAQILPCDPDGKTRLLAEVTVPANGMAVYGIKLRGKNENKATELKSNNIENSVYSLHLNADGDIASLIDKRNGRELVKEGKAIRLALIEGNRSVSWPSWEILKETIDRQPISIADNVSISIVENGPVRKVLRVAKEHGESRFVQDIILYEGALADRIDIQNSIDWATTDALLKAEFPLSVSNPNTTYDLGLGTVERGINSKTAYEVPAQYWADLTDADKSYGVTVMNDSKYGWDKPDENTMRLTLLHTPSTGNNYYAFQNRQDLGHHEFTYSLIGHDGALDAATTKHRAELLNQRVKPFIVPAHKGSLGRSYSLASIDNEAIMIKALKKAESDDCYVMRVYESAGKNQKGTVTFAADIIEAYEADGTEKSIAPASFSGRKLNIDINANGLRTYKVKLAQAQPTTTRTFASIPLSYNRKCFTLNQFTSESEFSEGYSYAIELVPASLTYTGIPFSLENKMLRNGMTCAGDTLHLPTDAAYNRVYLLAAAAIEGGVTNGTIKAGKLTTEITVPSYTGFIGQWGHTDHTEGYLYDTEVAWVGTHRHSPQGDEPYEFTYMFLIPIDLPKGATEIVLPDNNNIVIFAATAAVEPMKRAEIAAQAFHTANVGNPTMPVTASECHKENLLRPEHIIAWSGYVNDRERPQCLVDGDANTKWCDTNARPGFVEFDLGKPVTFSSWEMLNAASELPSYVSSAWLIQTRNNPSEEWNTVEIITGNRKNIVSGKFATPLTARYVRLFVLQPMQETTGITARIYEFSIHK